MFAVVWKLKGRLAAFALSFAVGLLVAAACRLAGRLLFKAEKRGETEARLQTPGCARGETFDSPGDLHDALRSPEVSVRAEAFRRLFLRPGPTTAYYDFERDKDFPAPVDRARLRLVNLDDTPEEEALVTFVRADSPAAVVLKRCESGWRAAAVVSAWLRYEDYPYDDWIETFEAPRPGRHVLVVRDSTGDATRYTRRARVLGLAAGGFEELAEVEEERIEPSENYVGAGWWNVKRRRTGSLSFTQQAGGEPARLRVSYRQELIKYTGSGAPNVYWRESDGVWHQARRHWRARSQELLGEAVFGEEQFVWNEQKQRFVREGS
jgi:hypothetical protein